MQRNCGGVLNAIMVQGNAKKRLFITMSLSIGVAFPATSRFQSAARKFQSSLQELTLFATEPSETPVRAETGTESKAIELRSYTDFVTADSTIHRWWALHTELGIRPTECRSFC